MPQGNPLAYLTGQGAPAGGGMGQTITSMMPNLPQGFPGAETLNRPAIPDIMTLIQMLMGGGAGAPPPLDHGAMMSMMQDMPPAFAGGMPQDMPRASMSKPAPSSKPKINGSSSKKKKSSGKEKVADDMIAADRAGSEVSKFVRK